MAVTSTSKRDGLFTNCFKHLQSTLDYVTKYSNNPTAHINSLKGIAKDYSELDITYKRSRKAYDATEKYFQDKDDCIEESEKVFERFLQEEPLRSYENHPIWQAIKNAGNGDATASVELETEHEVDVNRSIEEEGIVPSQFEPPVDPITKKIIQNPCRNQKCGHVYEYDSIKEHLKRIKLNKVKARCPYIGCTNMNMTKSFIIADNELRDQILTYNTQTTQEDFEESTSEIL
ncbi:hypothetical protein PPYR_13288 [Photinus pyralis]|uniref:E3 SUMO-protein ligase NSE2 n=2 Tax=Photinus pyralis TaxID=7054 RepID=A0A5N4A8T8_PHOPY|nr:uncharacterized protein LOC116178802 [Photinus pyralis]KAB0793668.1 hypothetical protein PPYR_13288 [Photinus pyralis]